MTWRTGMAVAEGAVGIDRRARRPSVGGDVIGLVHPHIRRPTARIARAHPPTDGVELAVDVADTVVIPRGGHRCKLCPRIGVAIEHFECAVEIDRAAADEAIGYLHTLRNAGATVHVYLLADGHRRERTTRPRHRRKGCPLRSAEIVVPAFLFRATSNFSLSPY